MNGSTLAGMPVPRGIIALSVIAAASAIAPAAIALVLAVSGAA
ncbi:hypothetical protein [Microbacterium enclense]|nr:hypothetical protein [Microbacterium enclense]